MSAPRSSTGIPARRPPDRQGWPWHCARCPSQSSRRGIVHKLAPRAWLINFTNPAGLITQAVTHHTEARVVGICDTPSELLHRIAGVLGADPSEVRCEYLGLNHLGWIRKIELRGKDVMDSCVGRRRIAGAVVSSSTLRSRTDPEPASHPYGVCVFLLLAPSGSG